MVLAAPYDKKYSDLFRADGIAGLLREPYIIRESGSGTRRETAAFLEGMGLDENALDITILSDSLGAVKNCITLGLGVSILSEKSCTEAVRLKKMLIFPLSEKGIFRNYYLIYPRYGLSFAAQKLAGFALNNLTNV